MNTATAGTYSITVSATGPAASPSSATLLVTIQEPGGTGFSLQLDSQSAYRLDWVQGQSMAAAKVQNLAAWRVDLRLHNFTNTTTPAVLTYVRALRVSQLRIDPAAQRIGIFDPWFNVQMANCWLSYAGRTDILLRMQILTGTSQYSLQMWNADGSGFAEATGPGCQGNGSYGNDSLVGIVVGADLGNVEPVKGSFAVPRCFTWVREGEVCLRSSR